MITPQELSEAFARNVMIMKKQVEGLTYEDSLLCPSFGGNCLNWVLGHIAASRDDVLRTLGEPPEMGEVGARYTRDSDPVTGMEEGTLSPEELLNWLGRSQKRIAAALNRIDEAALSRELTSGGMKTTVGLQTFILYFHETYHVGQTELLRQLAGKNDRIMEGLFAKVPLSFLHESSS